MLLLLLRYLYVFHVVVIFFVLLGILHVVVLIVVLVNIGINFNIGVVVVGGLVMVDAARSDQSSKLTYGRSTPGPRACCPLSTPVAQFGGYGAGSRRSQPSAFASNQARATSLASTWLNGDGAERTRSASPGSSNVWSMTISQITPMASAVAGSCLRPRM